MQDLIKGFFTHLNLIILSVAIAVALLRIALRKGTACEELFRWIALLGIGVGGVYTFIIHGFFPEVSARSIGWETSPFQWEVAVANLSVGLLGILSFRASYGFRLAMVVGVTCWLWGDAVGHIRQMVVAHNFAPGNAGSWFWLDVLVPLALIVLVILLKPKKPAPA